MNPDHKQSVLTTVLALVTALAAVVGAIGGLIATIYATDGGDPASTPTPPPAVSSKTPTAATPTPSATATATAIPRRGTPTPAVIEIAAESDRWWGSPATSSGDEGDNRGEGEELVLDWGCSDDSRGNGSKRECGSGTVAIQFDMSDLPDDVTIDGAVLRLYTADGSGTEITVYAHTASSAWTEDGSTAPECDASDEAADEVTEGESAWDVTTVVQDQHAGAENSVGFCLVLKGDAAVTFVSREGAESKAPALTITYRQE